MNLYLTSSSWSLSHCRQFLYGLRAYGRGNWKIISRHYVPSKTPVQISSHAQKYFQRLQNPTKKQRYSINDVGLYEAEPRVQNNASGQERLTFARGAYNPNHYGSGGQPTAMNNLPKVRLPLPHITSQASSSQAATLATGHQQQMEANGSFVAPSVEGDGSHMAWTSDQQGEFLDNQWFMDLRMD